MKVLPNLEAIVMQMPSLRLEMVLKMYWIHFRAQCSPLSATEDLCKGKIKVQNDF